MNVTKAGIVKFVWLAGGAYLLKDPARARKAIKLLRQATKAKKKEVPKDE